MEAVYYAAQTWLLLKNKAKSTGGYCRGRSAIRRYWYYDGDHAETNDSTDSDHPISEDTDGDTDTDSEISSDELLEVKDHVEQL